MYTTYNYIDKNYWPLYGQLIKYDNKCSSIDSPNYLFICYFQVYMNTEYSLKNIYRDLY